MTRIDQDLNNAEMRGSLWAAIQEGLSFVSRVFWGPDLEFCQSIHEDDWLISTMKPYKESVAKISAVIRSFEDGEALFNDLESHYVSLFISNRQGIAAPLYHSCYTGSQGIDSQPLLMGTPAMEMNKRLASSGLALDDSTGEISGTPAMSGSFPVTIEIEDSVYQTVQKIFTLKINW